MSATRERTITPKPTAGPAPARDYVVLVDEGNKTFKLAGIGKGANDIEAIRDATKEMSAADRSRPFVAIAKSRFNIRSRRVETVERESWS